ncbi:MAG: hypothetical protein KDD37_02540, partial [Bdellovibrionales bacterium]|nr:hypothetical protein [Bdellovibrionales bacterium]
MRKKLLSLVVASVGIAALYQNCSDVSFSEVVGDLGGPSSPIDPLACHIGTPEGISTYPSPCLKKPSFLNSQSVGFQLSNAQLSKFTLTANDSVNGTSSDKYLYIEVSTYAHPDSFEITYDTTKKTNLPLFSVCHTSTWTQALLGKFRTQRPFSTTIIQFGKFGNDPRYWIKIPAGTTKLTFNFGGIPSANYLAVWNLSDFKNNLLAVADQSTWNNYSQPEPENAPLPGDREDCRAL